LPHFNNNVIAYQQTQGVDMLLTVRRLIYGLNVANWTAAIAFVLVLGLFGVHPTGLEERLIRHFGASADLFRNAVVAVMLVGIAVCFPTHILFRKLLSIIDSVRAGRPFAADNAPRLRHIAWALLAIQLLDLAFGLVSLRLSEATGETIGWSFSLTGWISVLLLFVLARVFQQGAAMQDELEATV
jgi:hypothetical protein